MKHEELLIHVKKQLEGVEKKLKQQRNKKDREPYLKQKEGLEKKIETMEEQLKWVEIFREQGMTEKDIEILLGKGK